MSEYCRECDRLSQDCDALSADNNKLNDRIAQLEADLAHKDAYYAQFTLVPKPTALENETKPLDAVRWICLGCATTNGIDRTHCIVCGEKSPSDREAKP